MEEKQGLRSGRKAEAARNDRAIIEAARAVFVRDPAAPISAVAEHAGVGVGALYRRYSGKEQLLQTLCADGLRRFIAVAEEAAVMAGDDADASRAWEAFAAFVRGIVDSDVHSLTVHLAGTFAPTAELRALAERANRLANGICRRAQAAGALRPDLAPGDLAMIFEQITAIRLGGAERTAALRHRYLALLLDALRAEAVTTPLPGPPPSEGEVAARWRPPQRPAPARRS